MYDAAGALAKTHRRVFDALGRLAQDIGAYNQTTNYQYDANGNRTKATDPNNHATAYAYDALNRLATETDAASGITRYRYDALGRLLSVQDPAGLTTAYQYNGLGDRLREDSPNTGATLYAHDSAGNLARRTDANGDVALYTYDALNRPLLEDHAGSEDDISYLYDQTSPGSPGGVGRLAEASNGDAVLKFSYDLAGRLIGQSLSLPGSGEPLAQTAYQYDSAGWPTGTTYPSGAQVNYVRDAVGELAAVSLTQNGQTTPLASSLTRQPFGPLASFTHGNGLAWSRGRDLDGRPARETLGGLQDLAHAHDPAGNLKSLADALDPGQSQSFAYDALDRLNSATGGGYGALSYTYDKDGDRLTETRNGAATAYAHAPGSQRLQATSGAASQSYALDANGNTVQTGSLAFAYGPGNRLRQATQGGVPLARYAYDPLGRRAGKTVNGTTTYFAYGPSGELLAEMDAGGTPQAEHVWLDGVPLAVLKGGQVSYVHPDRLGTPRLVTDAAGTPVWRWASDPFGTTPANEDPDGDGTPFVYNLRFPGQYHDAETGLHYNMARYYDPPNGRYREGNPIGLLGGINAYTYVGDNPVNWVDPYGLERGRTERGHEDRGRDPAPASTGSCPPPPCDMELIMKRPSFDGKTYTCVYKTRGQIFTFPQALGYNCPPIDKERCMVDTSYIMPPAKY